MVKDITTSYSWIIAYYNVTGMASGMGQAAMGSYYTPAAAYGSLSAASMAAAAAAAAQQSAMSGLAAPAQVCHVMCMS